MRSVVLGPRAKVFGNIETRNLTVAEGAYLDGNVRMMRHSVATTAASNDR